MDPTILLLLDFRLWCNAVIRSHRELKLLIT